MGMKFGSWNSTPSNGALGALVIQDANGNTIVMSNSKITIKAQGLLEIDAPVITMKGRLVTDLPNPI